MSQEFRNSTTGHHVANSNELSAQGGRDLTYDQKKAAEAAFRGEPFNPAWSVAAATVYEGIVSAMCRMQVAALTSPSVEAPEECLTR
jgi:hypothetical protein